MFKKPEAEDGRPEPMIHHTSEPSTFTTSRTRAPATIGPSIKITGDVSGNEDVIIEGRVEGTISLHENVLTVGKEGQICATVHARAVFVEGKVEGDLTGEEQIVVVADVLVAERDADDPLAHQGRQAMDNEIRRAVIDETAGNAINHFDGPIGMPKQ